MARGRVWLGEYWPGYGPHDRGNHTPLPNTCDCLPIWPPDTAGVFWAWLQLEKEA